MFVDEMDLAEGKLNGGMTDVYQVAQEIHASKEWWDSCIRFTGGASRPDKSFACIIDVDFKANGEYNFVDP